MDIRPVLRNRGGAARWLDLREAGISRAAIDAARAAHVVERPHRGVYALPGTPRATVLSVIFRSTLTCVSWCQARGIPVPTSDGRTHVAVPTSRGAGLARQRPVSDVVVHRCGEYAEDLAIAHLDAAAHCTTPLEQVAVIDGALRMGAISPRDMSELAWGSRERREWVRRRVRGSAQSIGETYMRVALGEAGLRVEPQARIDGAGAVDLLVERAVVVEVDGERYHSNPEQFAKDRDRDRLATLRGLRPMRFTHNEVVHDLAEVVADVVAACWRETSDALALRTRLDAAARVSRPDWWAGSAWRRANGS